MLWSCKWCSPPSVQSHRGVLVPERCDMRPENVLRGGQFCHAKWIKLPHLLQLLQCESLQGAWWWYILVLLSSQGQQINSGVSDQSIMPSKTRSRRCSWVALSFLILTSAFVNCSFVTFCPTDSVVPTCKGVAKVAARVLLHPIHLESAPLAITHTHLAMNWHFNATNDTAKTRELQTLIGNTESII